MARKFEVCFADELPVGGRRILDVGGRSVGVFNVGNRYYALRNSCPHRGGPLCQGKIDGLAVSERPGDIRVVRDGEILRCPWHGWEFDLTTGQSVFNPHQVTVRTYEITMEGAEVGSGQAGAPEDPVIETYKVSSEPVGGTSRYMLYVHL